MAENSTHQDTSDGVDAETVASKTEQQKQEEQRVETSQRLSMDSEDMADAIDHEQDQKFDGDDETRYADEVDQALPDDAR